MKKSTRSSLILLLVTVLLSLAVLEFALRGFLPEDMATSWELRKPNPDFGWSLLPGVTYHYRMASDLIEVRHNSKGYHDVEHDYDNPQHVPRVVVLGDSFMEAFSVPAAATFYQQLSDRLRAAGRPAEVINLGVGGYGTLQEYLVYREQGRRYHPDVVVLGFYFGNDLDNNLLELEQILTGGTMKALSRPFLDEQVTDRFAITVPDYAGAMQRYQAAQQDKHDLVHRLAARFALMRAWLLVSERLFPEPASQTTDKQQQDMAALGMHLCAEAPVYSRAWESTRRILAQLNSLVQADGAQLLVFTVPAQHEVEPGMMQQVAADFYRPDLLCLQQAPAYRRLQEITATLGIGYQDLLPLFREQAAQGKAFFLADRHWNAAGHALAAAQVADAIGEHLPQQGATQ